MERTHRGCKHFAKRPDFNSRSWCDGVCLVYVEAVDGDDGTKVPGGDRPCPFYCGRTAAKGTVPSFMMMEIEDFPVEECKIAFEDGEDERCYELPMADGTSMRFVIGSACAMLSSRKHITRVFVSCKGAETIVLDRRQL